MNKEETKKFTEGLFQQMQILSDYLKAGVFQMINGVLDKKIMRMFILIYFVVLFAL